VQPKRLAEEEVLEKPRFFRQLDVAAMTPRLFLASVLAHYYPIRQLKKDRSKQLKDEYDEGQDRKDDEDEEEDEDGEALDDPFFGDDLWAGDEDAAGEDEPAFGDDEGEDDEDEDEGDDDSDEESDDDEAPREQEPPGFLSYLFGSSDAAKPDAVVVPRGRAADSDDDSDDDSGDYSDEDDEVSPPRILHALGDARPL
jgi:hypothetical protein